MIEPEMLAVVTQLGAAGLMGVMWLSERRGAAQREQQLSSAHERIMLQQKHLDVLVRALEDNTRALISLMGHQRELAGLLTRLERKGEPGREPEASLTRERATARKRGVKRGAGAAAGR